MQDCRNIRTMPDSEGNNQPQRRTALVAWELARLGIDVTAISEERFAEQGSLTEHRAGYILYWYGKGKKRMQTVRSELHDQVLHCQQAPDLPIVLVTLTTSCLFVCLYVTTGMSLSSWSFPPQEAQRNCFNS